MDTKLAQVAQAVIDSLKEAKAMDPFIDSSDLEARPVVVPVPYVPDPERDSKEVQRFTMTKWVESTPAGVVRRGFAHRPRGQLMYTVTIEARYEPFDDE